MKLKEIINIGVKKLRLPSLDKLPLCAGVYCPVLSS